MRNEFYADTHDVGKWSRIVRLVREHGYREVYQIAMLLPDRNRNEGGNAYRPRVVEPKVEEFFLEERRVLRGNDAPPREVGRVERLPHAVEMDFTISVEMEPFETSRADRTRYFSTIVDGKIHRLGSPLLAFLDPDNGVYKINSGGESDAPRPAGQHVSVHEIASTYNALRIGDGLLLYQHNPHIEGWLGLTLSSVCRAIDPCDTEVYEVFPDCQVAFVHVRKKQ